MSDDLRDSLMLGRAIGQAEADYRLLRWQRTTAAVATVLCAAAALLQPAFLLVAALWAAATGWAWWRITGYRRGVPIGGGYRMRIDKTGNKHIYPERTSDE